MRQKDAAATAIGYEGVIYHLMARGNRRQIIYRNERDRLAWLDYLGQACERTGWRVCGCAKDTFP
jgi:putative transposase